MDTAQNSRLVFPEIKEELSHTPLKFVGQLPPWLSGTLIRNGPVNIAINRDCSLA